MLWNISLNEQRNRFGFHLFKKKIKKKKRLRLGIWRARTWNPEKGLHLKTAEIIIKLIYEMFFFVFLFFCLLFYFGTSADGSYHLASTAWAAQRVPWTVDVIFFFFFFELCDVSCVSVRSRPMVQYSEKTTKKKKLGNLLQTSLL